MTDAHPNTLYKTLLPVIFMVAAVGGCGTIEIKNENPVVNRIAEQGVQRCDTRNLMNHPEEMPYYERLRRLVYTAAPAATAALEDSDAVICLDQRLDLMDRGFFGSTFDGVFYPAQDGQPAVITLRDNGMKPTVFQYADRYLNVTAKFLAAGNAPTTAQYFTSSDFRCQDGEPRMACREYVMWPLASSRLLKKHPEIATPPLKPQ